MYNLEKKIKLLLTAKSLSIEKLAVDIDISTRTFHNIFERNEINTKHLQKIADYMQVPITFFFDEDGPDQARIGVGGRADGAGECVDCKVKDEKIAELQALLEKAEERENRLFDTIAHLQRMCNYPVQNKKAG